MKKISILFIAIAAVTAFGFVSFNSNLNGKNSIGQEVNKITILKGAEKSGFSESNQNW